MAKWYERTFDAMAGEFGRAISDARAKLIEEGFWGRKVPEPSHRDSLHWSSAKEALGAEKSGPLDRLYESHPEFFSTPADGVPHREQDRETRDTATLSFADQLGWERNAGPAAHTHESGHEIEH